MRKKTVFTQWVFKTHLTLVFICSKNGKKLMLNTYKLHILNILGYVFYNHDVEKASTEITYFVKFSTLKQLRID